MTITTSTDDDLIWRGSVLERLELAEHDAEERDWRSGANEIARLRKYVVAIPAVQPAPVAEVQAEAVAGAYVAAAAEVRGSNLGLDIGDIADDVLRLTPTDAQAALARRDAATREAALREAADLADTTFSGSGTDAARIIRHAILAKIGVAK